MAELTRKTVTVLFSDVVDSTPLGEGLDPGWTRALIARDFDRMSAVMERHGGTVEKYIGDAVMAVFGIPQVHEDDALRAVRAAIEMREAVPELGEDVRRTRGIDFALKLGINSGDVFVAAGSQHGTFATGDPINV